MEKQSRRLRLFGGWKSHRRFPPPSPLPLARGEQLFLSMLVPTFVRPFSDGGVAFARRSIADQHEGGMNMVYEIYWCPGEARLSIGYAEVVMRAADSLYLSRTFRRREIRSSWFGFVTFRGDRNLPELLPAEEYDVVQVPREPWMDISRNDLFMALSLLGDFVCTHRPKGFSRL